MRIEIVSEESRDVIEAMIAVKRKVNALLQEEDEVVRISDPVISEGRDISGGVWTRCTVMIVFKQRKGPAGMGLQEQLLGALARGTSRIEQMSVPDVDYARAGIVGIVQGLFLGLSGAGGDQALAEALKGFSDAIEKKIAGSNLFPNCEEQCAHVEDDLAGERNWEAEAQEATYIPDDGWYQCDESEDDSFVPDEEGDKLTLEGTWDDEDDPNLVSPENRADIVPVWQYKSFDW